MTLRVAFAGAGNAAFIQTSAPFEARRWSGTVVVSKRVFGNKPLMKNRKSFWVSPFFKRRRLLKLFGKSFTKNLYNFRMLLSMAFQEVL
ncbi:hypothetical protein [Novacetimonas hansenii]|uniref:hypothetical protein n=1 Tax=Novacetimonas hansenii TaxID=436 RepID=UPI00248E82A9|nr:hypothetical protein [Novacetimonas hansenii]